MQALAILALVFAALSTFIPVVGLWIAMLCSVVAIITFRKHPTLSGVAIGINIIVTAFLSPSLLVASAVVATDAVIAASGATEAVQTAKAHTAFFSIYTFYVGWHVVSLVLGLVLYFTRKKDNAQPANQAA